MLIYDEVRARRFAWVLPLLSLLGCGQGPEPGGSAVGDPDANADGDCLTDAEELGRGTDPTRSDSDGDGVSDCDEIAIDVILFYLEGLRGQLQAIIAAQVRIAAAATRAAELGNVQLRTVVDCVTASMDAYLQNLNEGMKPRNRLVGLLNLFLQLAGLPTIPDLANLGDDAEAALAPLDAVIDSLKTVRAGLPG